MRGREGRERGQGTRVGRSRHGHGDDADEEEGAATGTDASRSPTTGMASEGEARGAPSAPTRPSGGKDATAKLESRESGSDTDTESGSGAPALTGTVSSGVEAAVAGAAGASLGDVSDSPPNKPSNKGVSGSCLDSECKGCGCGCGCGCGMSLPMPMPTIDTSAGDDVDDDVGVGSSDGVKLPAVPPPPPPPPPPPTPIADGPPSRPNGWGESVADSTTAMGSPSLNPEALMGGRGSKSSVLGMRCIGNGAPAPLEVASVGVGVGVKSPDSGVAIHAPIPDGVPKSDDDDEDDDVVVTAAAAAAAVGWFC